MYFAVSGSQRARSVGERARPSRPARTPPRSRRRSSATSTRRRAGRRSAGALPFARRRARRRPPCPDRRTGRRPRRAPRAVTSGEPGHGRRDRRPAEAGRAAGRPRRTAGRSGRPRRSAARRRQGRGGSRRAGAVFSEVRVVAATRSATSLQRRMAAMVYRRRPCSTAAGSRDSITGERVVLRRHVPENLAAFRRWYADPEVARLTRYQDGPMRPDEIERFFAGPGRRPRLAGDGDPRPRRPTGSSGRARSASSTATTARRCSTSRSARRMPGATATAPRRPQLMVDHAFGTLGLHRIALYGVRVQRARDPRLPQGVRLRRRGSRPRVDLARRALVGRAPDEHARRPTGAAAARRRRAGRAGRGVGAGCAVDASAGAAEPIAARRDSSGGRLTMASSGPAADAARADVRELIEATRATRSTTPGGRSTGSTPPSPPATSSGRRRSTRCSAT